MSERIYIGARYVPIVAGEWDITKGYEPLTIVTNQNNTYISRQFVPSGIQIDNETYWLTLINYTGNIPTMSETVKGGAKLGNGLTVTDETLSLSGESYTTTEKTKLEGIENNANNYSLPTMGSTIKGGAKLGNGLTVTDETLSLDSHTHNASDITSGEIPILHGGTGANTAADALTALGAASQTSLSTIEELLTPDYVTDCNGLEGSVSFRKYTNTTLNRPPNDGYGSLITIDYNQLAFGGTSGKISVRRYVSGSWSSWVSVSVS